MTFAPFLILFECIDGIFYLLGFSHFLRFSVAGFTTFNANSQVWQDFWVPSTLFFQNTLSNLSPAKNVAVNLHFSHMYARFCDFFGNPQIHVVTVFIYSHLNFHFYFPNVSWFKSVIFQLSNAPSTMAISLLDPEIS